MITVFSQLRTVHGGAAPLELAQRRAVAAPLFCQGVYLDTSGLILDEHHRRYASLLRISTLNSRSACVSEHTTYGPQSCPVPDIIKPIALENALGMDTRTTALAWTDETHDCPHDEACPLRHMSMVDPFSLTIPLSSEDSLRWPTTIGRYRREWKRATIPSPSTPSGRNCTIFAQQADSLMIHGIAQKI